MPYMLAGAGQGPVPETSTPGVRERHRSATLQGDLWEALSSRDYLQGPAVVPRGTASPPQEVTNN